MTWWQDFCESRIARNRERILEGKSPLPLVRSLLLRKKEKAASFHEVDRAKNKKLHGRFAGRQCVIVGSAPSVTDLPLERIQSDFIFLLNRTYLLAERFGVTPAALVMSDRLAYRDYGKGINTDGFEYVFFASTLRNAVERPNVYWFDLYKEPNLYDGFVSTSITEPLFHGHTVAHCACQIAIALGFSEIVLIGIDLSFDPGKPHFYASSEREKRWATDVSQSKKSRMISSFAFLANVSKRLHVKIINASPVDGLPGVPRKTFTEIFKSS
ncbi:MULTISPECIES: 6-hydroxymethylpterin diphosphokinase MptE-like protein [Sinorhizobium]|uniref:6-hydroxymethylpterin diphosphokinase MptE-like protein n=1 Tax=Sinorhizobium TaxID=28105 RepID=UPI001304E123|nr:MULTISPECIES: 6-hydroxymethylpterin diphosphokinase MptE-like protein [Sinorhizobium]